MQKSESIAKLAEALAKAHAEFKPVLKEANNPFFKSKYADLSTVIEATAGALSKNGLAVIQLPGKMSLEGRAVLTTMLTHSSGEWLSEEMEMPLAKPDAQGLGSATTYARRYSYQAILNVASEDDDGASASGATHKGNSEWQGSSTDKDEKKGTTVNVTQQRAFWSACQQGKKTNEQVLAYFKTLGIEKTEELPKLKLDASLKWAVNISDDLTEVLNDSIPAIAQKDYARLFGKMKEKSISNDDAHQYVKEQYNVDSLKSLTKQQFADLEQWISLQA